MARPVVERNDMERTALSGGDVTTRVAEAVADAADADPMELTPLYQTVDPDALEAVLESADDVRVRFEYADRVVEVRGDGSVTVDEERSRG